MRLDHLLSKENGGAGEIRASVVRRRVPEISVVQFSGTVVSESRYRIPEGPPVPIPNTEVKLRRAENTLPVTAREDRSAPTSGLPPSAESSRSRPLVVRKRSTERLKRLRDGNEDSTFEIVRPINPNGGVAQLGEHLPCKQGVMGSNPIISTRWRDEGRTMTLAQTTYGLIAQLVRARA